MAFRDLYSRHEDDERRLTRSALASAESRDARAATRPGLISILWRRKLTILATVVLCLAGGIVYVAITPPRYLASTAMLIDPRLGKTVGSDPVQPGFIVDNGAIDSQIKLFTSQTVLQRVAKMANLADDPEFNGSQRSLWQRLLHPASDAEQGVDLKALESAITIKRPERTYVVGIDVLARSPTKAADIANDLTKAYIEDQISSRVGAAQTDTNFVGQQMAKLADDIKVAQDKVESFKTKNNVVDATGLRSNEQQVGDLTKALGEARAKTSDAKARYEQVQGMRKRGQLDASSEALKSITIERLRQEQAQAEQNVAKLAETLGPRHPELIEARGKTKKVAGLIRDELKRLATSASGDYQSAKRNETQISAEVDRIKGQSTAISRDLVPLGELERNVRVLRASYDRFAQIRDGIAQQEADSPPGRVIAIAAPPVSPASPKKSLVAILSLAAGLFFGLAAALFAEGTSAPPQWAWEDDPVVYESPVAQAAAPQRARRRYWDDDI